MAWKWETGSLGSSTRLNENREKVSFVTCPDNGRTVLTVAKSFVKKLQSLVQHLSDSWISLLQRDIQEPIIQGPNSALGMISNAKKSYTPLEDILQVLWEQTIPGEESLLLKEHCLVKFSYTCQSKNNTLLDSDPWPYTVFLQVLVKLQGWLPSVDFFGLKHALEESLYFMEWTRTSSSFFSLTFLFGTQKCEAWI